MALFASALLHPALCADAPAAPPRTPSMPWHNPCGRTTVLPKLRQRSQQRQQQQQQQRQQRQQQQQETAAAAIGLNTSSVIPARSWSLRNVREKLHIARSHLRNEWNIINSLYRQVDDYRATYDWLPSHQLRWYRREIACLDRNSQAAKVLPRLHASLQNFSATMQDLQKPRTSINYDLPFDIARNHLIAGIATQVKGILCEVETSLTERSIPRPPPVNPTDFSWIQNPDSTGQRIQDWSVIAAYGDALADWTAVLRQLGYAPKLQKGETAPTRPCGPINRPLRKRKPKKDRKKERKQKTKNKESNKVKNRPRLRPGQRRGRNRHRRRRHQGPRISTLSPLT